MDAKEIQKVYALEPGKIYCLQIDPSITDLRYLEAIITGFKQLDITIVAIDQTMKFVPVPEGYEVVKKQ